MASYSTSTQYVMNCSSIDAMRVISRLAFSLEKPHLLRDLKKASSNQDIRPYKKALWTIWAYEQALCSRGYVSNYERLVLLPGLAEAATSATARCAHNKLGLRVLPEATDQRRATPASQTPIPRVRSWSDTHQGCWKRYQCCNARKHSHCNYNGTQLGEYAQRAE